MRAAFLALIACGPNIPPEAGAEVFPRLAPGHYTASADVTDSTGSCTWVGNSLSGSVEVDEAGQVSAGLGSLVSCQTEYPERGTLRITCKGSRGIGGTVTADGWLTGPDAYGRATGSGDIGGCKGLTVSWDLRPRE